MKVRYVGPKPLPYRINTPIPFVSRSEYEGQLEFNPECEIANAQWAWFLIKECGGNFEQVQTRTVPIKSGDERHKELIEKATGKRFTGKAGKWNAWAYLKKHKLQEVLGLKKLQIGDKVVHWELVPVTLADVGAHDAPVPWNKPTEGQQEEQHESSHG